jgi:hypothetical protein
VGTRGRFATQRSGETVDDGLGLLDSVPEGVDEGAIGCQLVHVDLYSEHFGSFVLEDALEGGECRRFLLSAFPRRSPQSQLSQ